MVDEDDGEPVQAGPEWNAAGIRAAPHANCSRSYRRAVRREITTVGRTKIGASCPLRTHAFSLTVDMENANLGGFILASDQGCGFIHFRCAAMSRRTRSA